jgi:mono/diheme cytochrome c family protein
MKLPLVLVIAALVGGFAPVSVQAADEAAVVRGGRLYDFWSRESKVRSPTEMQPTFAAKGSGISGADSWRCVSCHGWDYKGSQGFVGIRNAQGRDPAAIVATLKNSTHGYAELIRERELLNLAKFVSKGQTDVQAVLEASRRAAAPTGKLFSTICANCHGQDGSQLREVPPLGDSARQHPAEVLHVMVNGHPGGEMPAMSALGVEVAGKILAHLQTLPSLNLPASIAHGGRLYDDWQAEVGATRQLLPHPAYPRSGFYANDAALTWRCSACHGWDYLGYQGSYAKGPHATGIKGIRAMAGVDPGRIEQVLRDNTHSYGAVLKQRDLQDLANFVSLGQVDMDPAIDRTSGNFRGDALRGGAYFGTLCASCHGLDGQTVGTPPLGRLIRANPWSGFHSLLNGHPSEKMPALRELDRQILIDILAYAHGLPDTR